MAAVLIALIALIVTRRTGYLTAAVVLHVVNMIAPQVFRPAAVIWFSFSHLLGTVVSTVVLTTIFFVVVTPVALVRKALGADSLKLRAFKAARTSVMQERNHTFRAKDLEQPY